LTFLNSSKNGDDAIGGYVGNAWGGKQSRTVINTKLMIRKKKVEAFSIRRKKDKKKPCKNSKGKYTTILG